MHTSFIKPTMSSASSCSAGSLSSTGFQIPQSIEAELYASFQERGQYIEAIPVQTDTTARNINATTLRYCCICDEQYLAHIYEQIAVADALSGDAINFIVRDKASGKIAATVIVSMPSAAEARQFLQSAGARDFVEDSAYDGWLKVILLCTASSFRRGEGTLALTYALWFVTTKHGLNKSFLEIGSGITNIKAYSFYRAMSYTSINDAKPYMMWNVNHGALLAASLNTIRLHVKQITHNNDAVKSTKPPPRDKDGNQDQHQFQFGHGTFF